MSCVWSAMLSVPQSPFGSFPFLRRELVVLVGSYLSVFNTVLSNSFPARSDDHLLVDIYTFVAQIVDSAGESEALEQLIGFCLGEFVASFQICPYPFVLRFATF